MNHQSTASLKVGRALVICSRVIMGIAFLAFIFVMEIMTALTTQMKMKGISAVSNVNVNLLGSILAKDFSSDDGGSILF